MILVSPGQVSVFLFLLLHLVLHGSSVSFVCPALLETECIVPSSARVIFIKKYTSEVPGKVGRLHTLSLLKDD